MLAQTPANWIMARRRAAPSDSRDTLPTIGIPRFRNWPTVAKDLSIWVNAKRYGKPGAEAEEEHERHVHRAVRRGWKNRHLWRIDDAELDLFGLRIGGMGDLGGFAPRHQFLVIPLQDRIIAVKILGLHQHARRRFGDLFDLS